MSKHILPVVILCLSVCTDGFSQDGHYWTQQYGTRSMLLSGSVIGGVEDLGAVYYNPGRLAVITNSAFLISASVYEYNSIKVTNAFGDSKNVNKSDLKGVPTLAAVTFKIKKLPNHYFAYAVLTRQNSNLDFAFQNETHSDVFTSIPGTEYFGAEVGFSQRASEHWTGVTWSHPISSKVSVGITGNYTTSSQSKVLNTSLQSMSEANEVSIYRRNRSYSYNQGGLLFKGGLGFVSGRWQTGVTLTSPIFRLSGKGTYRFEEFYSPFAVLAVPSVYSSSYQSGLKATARTPWSIGVGASRGLGRNKIHLSAEWFSAVPKYTIIEASDHISQSNPNDTIRFRLVDERKSVINFGIGTEIFLSEKISGYGSFCADFTAVPDNATGFVGGTSEVNSATWNVNFYHWGAGIILKLGGADISLGATHTGAGFEIPRPINFPDSGGSGIFSNSDKADFRWDRWRAVFSFSFPFLKDYAKKLTEGKSKPD